MRNCGAYLLVLTMGVAGAMSNAAAQTVHVLGCVKPGVEIGCLIMTDRHSGKTYEIGSAVPRPDPSRNLAVELKGQVFQGASLCMQGTTLKNITWTYTKMRCTPAQ